MLLEEIPSSISVSPLLPLSLVSAPDDEDDDIADTKHAFLADFLDHFLLCLAALYSASVTSATSLLLVSCF